MNKCVTGLLATSALLGTLTLMPTHVSAATWHNGTPVTLRGKYKGRPLGKERNYSRIYIRQDSAPFYNFWSPMYHGKRSLTGSAMLGIAMDASYKKIGTHTYEINGMDKMDDVNQTMRVYKRGSKIKYTWTHSFKHRAWEYKY
ncbi:hypothetical protein [Secundilactobacillus silagei]|uniref:Extracellular protein n=1 Tax=Secundilactobacillus silagei JCM 19001 TaxID=1302250 RepID=A0A1Z5IJN3_9LACO|nr:hypothetical protein [Secundilactobacillus silagei]TDG72835.1 hypothetical protein C5L25_002124 [Secundilactobacillus silagei JCM 19001]GAX01641.1 hypothetical protein IWT126_01684 [Secundilactobacillus silagei JCM 19001]